MLTRSVVEGGRRETIAWLKLRLHGAPGGKQGGAARIQGSSFKR